MKKGFLFFFLLLSLAANAERIVYVLFDPGCMDRLEYRYNQTGPTFTTYQVHTDQGIIALEVGVESKKEYSKIPAGAVGCGDKIFDQKFVKSINSELIDVYVVMPSSNGRYRISPARMASYLSKDMTNGHVIKPEYEFAFNAGRPIPEANLATERSDAQVFFMGEGRSRCEPLHFRSISKNTCRPMTEIYYLPGLGIVEEQIGNTLEEEQNNRFVLTKINGVSVEEYKKAFCEGRRIQLGTPTPPQPVVVEKTSVKAPVKAKEFVPKKCKGTAKPGFHLVEYGDNLFSIARRTGLTVSQLKKWNHLRSNKIYACTQLRITPPPAVAKAKVRKKNRPAVAKMRTQPKPARRKFTAKGVRKKTASRVKKAQPKKQVQRTRTVSVKSTTGVHVVKKGESLYRLAKLYGYTVERFAHMNGLRPDAVLKPGMELFTTDCSCETDGKQVKHPAPEIETDTIDSSKLPMIGEKVTIPTGKVIEAPKLTYHVVQEGETIWSIANEYGFDTSALMKRNNLEPGEVLVPGQKIYFPK